MEGGDLEICFSDCFQLPLLIHAHTPSAPEVLRTASHEPLEDFVDYMGLLLSFSCWQFKSWLFGGWLSHWPPTHVSGLCLEIPSLLWMKCSVRGGLMGKRKERHFEVS